MLHFSKKLILLSVILAGHLTWSYPLPQEDEDGNENSVNEEEVEEQEEEEYFEEAVNKGSPIKPDVQSTVVEKVDKYLKQNVKVQEIVSEKLGIANFSTQSFYKHGANALFSYVADHTKDKISTQPLTSTPTVQLSIKADSPAEEEGIKKTFEISIPNDIGNNAGGGTIEFSIPTHLTSESQLNILNPNHLTLLSKSTQEDNGEGFKSIEDAIKQALLLANQNAGFDLSTLARETATTPEINELDIIDTHLIASGKSERDLNSTLKSGDFSDIETTLKSELSQTTQKSKPEVATKGIPEVIKFEIQTTPEEEYVQSEEDITERTKKPKTVRTTTARPSLTNNPIADMIKARFQNNGISGFFFDRVISTTKSGAKVATSYLWCAWFDYCPDDKEEKEAEARAV